MGVPPVRHPVALSCLARLVYREHDLEGLLAELGELQRDVLAGGGYNVDGPSLLDMLKEVCGEWTIYARYSPRQADIREAGRFLDRVRELRQWLA